MADSKNKYSSASKNYVENIVPNSVEAQHSFNVSKAKEDKYNESWKGNLVDINEIVDKFTPNSNSYVNGYKYVYENDDYEVVADMVSGYLRIKNKNSNQYVKLDGKPGNNVETHFKIKKRGEM